MKNSFDVSVGVIRNDDGKILISLRSQNLHQGGLWEFPGGKIESDESSEQALARELQEELNIRILSAQQLTRICHQYPDRTVVLHVFVVDKFQGTASHSHGQPIRWVAPEDLVNYPFPDANQPIVSSLLLPDRYAILNDNDITTLQANLEKILTNGVTLLQVRSKLLTRPNSKSFLLEIFQACKHHACKVLINSALIRPEHLTAGELDNDSRFTSADGIHLTSQHLLSLSSKPKRFKWVAASCHSLDDMLHAQNIGVDFVVLGSVLPTQSHPAIQPIGWQNFSQWSQNINIPVYALGGMAESSLAIAKMNGGHGIAGISMFLQK